MQMFRNALIAALLSSAAFVSPVLADNVNITFLLVNDIYKIDNSPERGGFARLNAVVKNRYRPRLKAASN